MSKQQLDVHNAIRSMAEEQVLFLKNRYKMNPVEIISLYTGERPSGATYTDAVNSIMHFNAQNAKKYGFVTN